ncbi:protein PAXX isoform X2 [Artibeus jamaicensis]|nr:protein PAXX isoform X2 [Artibeus jamaicensis]
MVPPLPPLPPPLCTLPPGPGPPRFICYCEEEKAAGDSGQGGFNLYVTDAAELWSTCLTSEGLATLKAHFGLSAAEDVTPRFRAVFKQQAVTFTPQEDAASLTISGGPSTLDFELSKVPGPEAAPRLQALTLGLAERVCSLERQLASVEEMAASPRKSPRPVGPQQFLPGSPLACDLGWGCTRSTLTQFPHNKSHAPGKHSVYVERWLWPWDPTAFRCTHPHPAFPRSRFSERLPWTWGQEAMSWRVPHQPWLQK